MSGPPPSVQQLQKVVEGAMDDVQRNQLVPMQKEAFLCSARCCDAKNLDMLALQQCTVDCQQRVQGAHQVLFGTLEDFQKRFQRCLVRCDDMARESLPSTDPSDRDIRRAQEQQLSCMEACGKEYVGKVPKLKADLNASLQKLK